MSLIGAVVALLAGLGMLFAAIGLLLSWWPALHAVPFGTIAYLAVWGFFNRGGASGTLGLLMPLKRSGGVPRARAPALPAEQGAGAAVPHLAAGRSRSSASCTAGCPSSW